jgi:AcrR family transcriptional regulator
MRKTRPLSPPPSTERSVENDPFETSTWQDGERTEAAGSTRGRILTSAERLFAELGFSGVSMPMIARASGITAGAIYKHFDSKDDLFFEVIRRTVQSVPLPSAPESTPDIGVLPQIVAMYTTPRLKLLRQLAVEIHSASARHPRVRRLLRRSLDVTIRQIREGIETSQKTGKLDAADPELLASAIMVFIMGLMHMETLLPNLVGNAKWHDFVRERAANLLGI